MKFKIGSVELQETKGILLRNVVFFEPKTRFAPERRVLEAEEIFIEMPITLPRLMQGERNIKKITVNKMKVHLSRDVSGRFREPELLTPKSNPEKKMNPFPIRISQSDIHFSEALDGRSLFSGLEILLDPKPVSKTDHIWEFKLVTTGEYVRQIAFEGRFVPENQSITAQGAVRKFQWDREFGESFIDILAQHKYISPENIKIAKSFRSKMDFVFSLETDSNADFGVRFDLCGELSDGRIALPQFDGPLTEINANYRITDDSVLIENLKAASGAIRAFGSYSQEGLRDIRNANVDIKIDSMKLDSKFLRTAYPFLKEKMRNFLDDFELSAMTNVSGQLVFANGSWKPHRIRVDAKDFELSFEKFPYKIERLAGSLELDESEVLRFNFNREDEFQKIAILGRIKNTLSNMSGSIRLEGFDIPIDDKLMRTFAQKRMDVITSLRPQGNLDARILFDIKEGGELGRYCEIIAKDCSIKYDKFPYPLRNVSGKVVLNGSSWGFEQMRGYNESAVVSGGGTLKPRPEGGYELFLDLDTQSLPLDGDIIHAILDPNQRELLDSLQAKGKADLKVLIRYLTAHNKLDLKFDANLDAYANSNSLNPKQFPCKIEQIKGKIHYDNGEVFIKQFRGQNKDMKISAGIQCRFSQDGSMRMDISPLHVNQLPPSDRDLHLALPENVRSFLSKMKIEGAVNVDQGTISVFKNAGPNSKMNMQWDLAITLHRNHANFGMNMKNINGRLYQCGLFEEGNNFQMGGWLELDTVQIEGLALADIIGPYYFDGKQLKLGQLPPPSISPKKLPFPIMPMNPMNTAQPVPHVIPERVPSQNRNLVSLWAESETMRGTNIKINTWSREGVFSGNPGNYSPEHSQLMSRMYKDLDTGEQSYFFIPVPNRVPSDLDNMVMPTFSPQETILSSPLTEQWTRIQANPTGDKMSPYFLGITPRRTDVITARLFDGDIACKGWIDASDTIAYRVQIHLRNADIREAVRELSPGTRAKVQGRLSASSEFWGVGGNRETLGGYGKVTLRDADIYELPQMMQILQILSIRSPQKGAFTSSDIDFRLIGNNVILDSVHLDGNLFNLRGKGEMRLDSMSVNMQLRARLGNRRSQIPVVSDILGGAGDQITQIRVEGKLTGNGPHVSQEALPGVKKWIDKFQNGN